MASFCGISQPWLFLAHSSAVTRAGRGWGVGVEGRLGGFLGLCSL